MKRKLIVTLVATALELYAATAGAQAAGCFAGGISNGATPVRTGPLNPINGFPEYVTDSTGVSVQRCLDPVLCFFDPVIPTDPFSVQIGSGVEAFYWGADANFTTAAGNVVGKVGMAAETAFLQVANNGAPVNGSQFPFLRLRFVIGVPVDGTYTVEHPYGIDTFTVTGATGARDIFSTVDKGLAPSATVQGSVGPWLSWDPTVVAPPVGFLGDGGAAAVPNPVVGSPCGRNFIQLTGVDTAGNAVDFGGGTGEFVLFSDLFNVQGQIYDGRTQTPLAPTRLTYSRTLAGAGQIDSFGTSTATAGVTVKDGPTIPVGSSRIPLALTLDELTINPTLGIDSLSTKVLDASALPPIVAMTATEPGAAPVTDPTTLNLHLVDFVDIAAADWDPASATLAVTATSADLRTSPALTLRDFGTFTAGNPTKLVNTIAPPATVTVDSAAGGSATAQVRVIAAAAPSAPTNLISTAQTSLTITLQWTDTSSNETAFNIYRVAGTTRTLVGTVGANVTSTTISGLTPATVYTFQVDATNFVGSNGSNTVTVATPALPLAPSAVAASLGTATRTINVSWTDNSADETSFTIQRATAAAGPYATVGTAPAGTGTGTRSFLDSGGALLTGNAATYFYRVIAVRGPDISTAAQSAGLATPAAAQSVTGLSATVASATQVNLVWVNRAGATSNQIFRSAGTGAFTLLTTVGATATSFSDTTVTAGTGYRYRVDAVNWAGSTPSGVTASVTPQAAAVLVAPGNLAATFANSPALSWQELSTGETNYRVGRTPYTVNANGSVTIGARTVLSSVVAANATAFTDGGATRDLTYLYDVGALSGATVGPQSTVFTVAGALPTANRPTLTRSLVGTAPNQTARVTVTWGALNQPNVGGYVIERCAGNGCTNFAKVNGTAVNTTGTVDGRATASFVDNTVARATAYTYRMRAVGGTGMTFTYPNSPTQTVTTQ